MKKKGWGEGKKEEEKGEKERKGGGGGKWGERGSKEKNVK